MPDLQRRVSSMQELRHLIAQLGRRASARGTRKDHFAPQVACDDSRIGVAVDPASKTCLNGLTLSSSLTEMLPSEAVLLRSASPTLRRLFLAKKVEAKLLSYQLSGWYGRLVVSRLRTRHVSLEQACTDSSCHFLSQN